MATLWIGNFSFESQLQGNYAQSAFIRRFEAEFTPCLIAAASDGDIILCPQNVENEYAQRVNELGGGAIHLLSKAQVLNRTSEISSIQPWGWSKPVVNFIKQLGTFRFPNLDGVQKFNSRNFAFELSNKLGCRLPGERRCQNLSEITSACLEGFYRNGIVLKTNQGQSGRGQLISETCQLTAPQTRWIEKKCFASEALFLEPKLSKLIELGIQWDIPESGDPILFGITLLESDVRGQYLSSCVGFNFRRIPELEIILQAQRIAVQEIQAQGYFGPVGIDAMVYEDENGERKSRALQDINARWTMGRLAIHWAKLCFPQSTHVTWQHSSERPDPSAIQTSPNHVGGELVRASTWCFLKSEPDV